MLEPVASRDPNASYVRSSTDPLLMSPNRSDSTEGASKHVSLEKKCSFKKARYIHGWRMGITLCAVTAGTVFTINLILAVWALSKDGLEIGGFGTIQEGSCKNTARLSLWLHWVINLLSTLLLGASNYTMQCLASPTREEVGRAHHQNVWLDIGVPSVRNLTRIARGRVILWWLLVVSGIPLHLLYNSVIFSTLSARMYNVYVASPDLVSQNSLNWSSPVAGYWGDNEPVTLEYFRNVSTWQQLDNAACVRAYARPFLSAHGDVVAISGTMTASTMIELIAEGGDNIYDSEYSWICSSFSQVSQYTGCEADKILKNISSWTVSEDSLYFDDPKRFSIQYCLSQLIDEHCGVHFSIVIMGVVMACNFLKALCMLLALRQQKSRPLVTLGDAIEEFLVRPDKTTRLACLSNKNSFSGERWRDPSSKWEEKGHRWFSSLSTQRWVICSVL